MSLKSREAVLKRTKALHQAEYAYLKEAGWTVDAKGDWTAPAGVGFEVRDSRIYEKVISDPSIRYINIHHEAAVGAQRMQDRSILRDGVVLMDDEAYRHGRKLND